MAENPVPVDEQEPSAKAAKQIDERATEFRKAIHEQSEEMTSLGQGENVEVTVDSPYDSHVEHGRNNAKGKTGTVVGQAFVASEGSAHAGKVCRGVMLDNGDLITTPEERLQSTKKVSVGGFRVSQERWDSIFGGSKA